MTNHQPEKTRMTTILPFTTDDDTLREGIQIAAARLIDARLSAIIEMAQELGRDGLVDRAAWDAAWQEIATTQAEVAPMLDYAKAFLDQWPESDDDEADNA
jgi:hypothetical protein